MPFRRIQSAQVPGAANKDLSPQASSSDDCDSGALELQPTKPFIFFDGFESGDTSAWSQTVP